MATITLGHGRSSLKFEYDEARFEVLAPDETHSHPLTDAGINASLENAIGSDGLENLIVAGDSVLIVCSDATRATGSAQIVNLLVRRLIENGIQSHDLAIIFATGIHRAVRPQEKIDLLTSFIAQRIRTLDHDAYDESQLIEVGTMKRGASIEVNRALKEFRRVIITGAVGFHYFAGFTGGRKSICPGLASARTIEATHMLALDFEKGGRRSGVGIGLLDGNAVNEACDRVAELVNPSFSINTIVDDLGRAVGIFAGHWRAAHRQACGEYLTSHKIGIDSKRDLVVASCGGLPWDINLIQAHKTMEMAAQACNPGGTIVLLAECIDGLGRSDFLKWFAPADSRALESLLREKYEVNGQTAWSLRTKTETFRIHLISNLPEDIVRMMGMIPANTLAEALVDHEKTRGLIMPNGASIL